MGASSVNRPEFGLGDYVKIYVSVAISFAHFAIANHRQVVFEQHCEVDTSLACAAAIEPNGDFNWAESCRPVQIDRIICCLRRGLVLICL